MTDMNRRIIDFLVDVIGCFESGLVPLIGNGTDSGNLHGS